MTNLDQFESVFKSADKTLFSHEAVSIQSVLVITDVDAAASESFVEKMKGFLSVLDSTQSLSWSTATGSAYQSVADLITQVENQKPDLICTYRNLHIPAIEHPFSLGVYLDVLTQATPFPVLTAPHPARETTRNDSLGQTKAVMAITDHMTGDHHLVSYAAQFTKSDGVLYLTHVEDQRVFDRYMTVIGKVPSIDTDDAKEDILEQLLKEPHDYIGSCREVLQQEGVSFKIEEVVTLGRHLADYCRLVKEHRVDLLVLNAKEDDQLAMHGLAYPLTVELRETPLLLL